MILSKIIVRSINVQLMLNANLMSLLKNIRDHVLLLQEVHDLIVPDTLNSTLHAVTDPLSRTGIIIRKSCQMEILDNHRLRSSISEQYRPYVMDVAVRFNRCKTLIISVYTPQSFSERETLFQEISFALKRFTHYRIIMGGDFNSVQRIEDANYVTARRPQLHLEELLHDNHLFDCYLALKKHPEKDHFTNVATNGTSHARLDRFYISESLQPVLLSYNKDKKRMVGTHFSVRIALLDEEHETGPGMFIVPKDVFRMKASKEYLRSTVYVKTMYRCFPSMFTWDKIHRIWTTRLIQLTSVTRAFHRITNKKGDSDSALSLMKEQTHSNKMIKHLSYGQVRRAFQSQKQGSRIGRIEETTSLVEILRKATTFYSNLYAKQPLADADDFLSRYAPCPISDDDRDKLCRPFTKDELLSTIATYRHSQSSPGEDGWPYKVFAEHSDYFAEILSDTLNEMSHHGSLPETMKTVLIKLLPKPGKTPSVLSNLRPISLSNTAVKLCSQAINARITPLLDSLIGADQYGFVPGRDPIHAVQSLRLATNCMLSHPEINAGFVNLDLEKAFDKIDHGYLLSCLERMNFGRPIITAISAVLTQQTGVMYVNKACGRPFPLQSGVRQGNPLSPTLFILGLDPLLNAVKQVVPGVQLESFHWRYTAFADDVCIPVTCRQDLVNVEKLTDVFATVSGCTINKSKTTIYHNNPTSSIPFSVSTMPSPIYIGTGPISHLGVTVTNGYRMEDFLQSVLKSQWIIQDVSIPLETRCTIVNIYQYSKLVHKDQHWPMDESTLRDFQASIRKSLVFDIPNTIAFDRLHAPLSSGGFGLMDLGIQMQGLRAKWVFHLLTHKPNSHLDPVRQMFAQFSQHLALTSPDCGAHQIKWFHIFTHHSLPGISKEEVLQKFAIWDQSRNTRDDKLWLRALQAWFKVTKPINAIPIPLLEHASQEGSPEISIPPADQLSHLRDIEGEQVTMESCRHLYKKYYQTRGDVIIPRSWSSVFPELTRDDWKAYWRKTGSLYHKYPHEMSSLRFLNLGYYRRSIDSFRKPDSYPSCAFCMGTAEVETLDHLFLACVIIRYIWQVITTRTTPFPSYHDLVCNTDVDDDQLIEYGKFLKLVWEIRQDRRFRYPTFRRLAEEEWIFLIARKLKGWCY